MSNEPGRHELRVHLRREAERAEREAKGRRSERDERRQRDRREGAKLRGREVGRQRAARLGRERENEGSTDKQTRRAAQDWNGGRREARLGQQQQQLPRKRRVSSRDSGRSGSGAGSDASRGGRDVGGTSSGSEIGRRKRLRAWADDVGSTCIDGGRGGGSSSNESETNGKSSDRVVPGTILDCGRRGRDHAGETRGRRSGDKRDGGTGRGDDHSFRRGLRPAGSSFFGGGTEGLAMVGSSAARSQGTGTLASPAAAAAALGKGSGTLALAGAGGSGGHPAASLLSVCGMGTLAVWNRATAS